VSSATKVTDPAPTGEWRTATVRSIEHLSPHAVQLRLQVPDRIDHLPGQHYVVRLTAEDGYVAQRSYSIASPPADPLLELYVERLPDGEVSGFLAEVLEPGDELSVRGPIGGWFVWRADTSALGLAGGSGAVPLVAMLRHALRVGRPDLLRLAVSARTLDRLPYVDELLAHGALVALTADAIANRSAGRLTAAELAPLVPPSGPCFICGSNSFAEGATDLLAGLDVASARIRVERFGASG
jgi:ferredoxin-NADP reductase